MEEDYYNTLPIELKVEIAEFDSKAFEKMLLFDKPFINYLIAHPVYFDKLLERNIKKYEDRFTTIFTLFDKRHNINDKPAVIHYFDSDKKIIESMHYYWHGFLHRRNDEPAIIRKSSDGTITTHIYYKKGLISREDEKPQYVQYDNQGQILAQEWYKNDIDNNYVYMNPIRKYLWFPGMTPIYIQ